MITKCDHFEKKVKFPLTSSHVTGVLKTINRDLYLNNFFHDGANRIFCEIW